jgi:hypothetical protein
MLYEKAALGKGKRKEGRSGALMAVGRTRRDGRGRMTGVIREKGTMIGREASWVRREEETEAVTGEAQLSRLTGACEG